MRRILGGVFAASLLLSGCERREEVTYNLEAVLPTEAGGEALFASEEYQIIGSHWYEYPGLGEWMGGGATASVLHTEPGKLIVFTEDEDGSFQWRDAYYAYGFYDAVPLVGRAEEGGGPLVISPLLMSADGTAVAYQDMLDDGYVLALSQIGQGTIFLDGGGRIYEDGEEIGEEAEYDWSRFEYCWSADGRQLFYYKMTRLDDNSGDALRFPDGVFIYDRGSGQVREAWEPMEIEISSGSSQVASIAADAAENTAVLFLLFDEESGGRDILLRKENGRETMRFLNLSDHSGLQIKILEDIYYCQQNGEILRCSLSEEESEALLDVGSGLQTFLVTEDESRIFTVELRGQTEDVCMYAADEEGNWHKQVLYVGAEGARHLQLSADGSELLVECTGRAGTMALVLSFGIGGTTQ